MRRVAHYYLAVFSFCIGVATVLTISQLSALELDQAIGSCRASHGKPAYMACKQNGGTHEACFDKAKSIVQSCVRSAMTAARPKAALFSADKLSAPPAAGEKPNPADAANDAAASLVAPPRTISDISAILDQQKPDPAEIAKLAATAEAAVPAGLKGADLADFHYKRAQARALLGRSDALDDAELAASNATGADYKNLGARYEQLLMRLLRDAGQHKRAGALLAKQMALFASQSKGKLFGLNFSLVLGAIKSGDTNLAESYAARNRSLLTEAQRWPVFPIYGMAWQAIVEDGNARIEESRGRYAEAQAAYHKASILYTSSMKTLSQWESRPAEGEMERFADWDLALEGVPRSSRAASVKARPTCGARC
jgi:hypothetical protein